MASRRQRTSSPDCARLWTRCFAALRRTTKTRTGGASWPSHAWSALKKRTLSPLLGVLGRWLPGPVDAAAAALTAATRSVAGAAAAAAAAAAAGGAAGGAAAAAAAAAESVAGAPPRCRRLLRRLCLRLLRRLRLRHRHRLPRPLRRRRRPRLLPLRLFRPRLLLLRRLRRRQLAARSRATCTATRRPTSCTRTS